MNGNKVEFQIRRTDRRTERSLQEAVGCFSDGDETKLQKKVIGRKAKNAGFRDYIKYFCNVIDRLLIFSAGVETSADQLVTPGGIRTYIDPPETPYVKFTFLFRSGCIHPILRFTADSRLFG